VNPGMTEILLSLDHDSYKARFDLYNDSRIESGHITTLD
jgi:hypothetical protein